MGAPWCMGHGASRCHPRGSRTDKRSKLPLKLFTRMALKGLIKFLTSLTRYRYPLEFNPISNSPNFLLSSSYLISSLSFIPFILIYCFLAPLCRNVYLGNIHGLPLTCHCFITVVYIPRENLLFCIYVFVFVRNLSTHQCELWILFRGLVIVCMYMGREDKLIIVVIITKTKIISKRTFPNTFTINKKYQNILLASAMNFLQLKIGKCWEINPLEY